MSAVLDFLRMAVCFSKIINLSHVSASGVLCAEVLMLCMTSVGKHFRKWFGGKRKSSSFPTLV